MRVESRLRVDRDVLLATASYGITLVRLLIAGFGALTLVWGDASQFAIVSIVLVMALDYFDGATFDKSDFSAIKKWRIRRRIADSVSDRLVIQIICVPLLLTNSSFLWLYLPILGRELAISGYISKEFAKGILVYPRSISKIACGMVGLSVIGFMALPVGLTLATTALMIILSAFALLDYGRRVKNFKASIDHLARSNESLEEVF